MKNFLAIYMGTQEARAKWDALSDAERKKRQAAGMRAWMSWGEANAGAIVDQGTPLGKTKRASTQGISDFKNGMTGYVIVRAESHAAAASGVAVAGVAYVVDYHLIPRRLTPGWELRLPRRSVALGFVALGVTLAVAGFLRARR